MTHTLLLDSNADPTATSPQISEEWAEQLEQVMQQDRDFFLQHPEQDYYVRSITAVEVAEGQAMGKSVTETTQVLVGEIAPGSRVRLTILDGGPPPVAEFKAIQQQIRQEMGIKSVKLKDRLKHRGKARPKAKGFG